MSPDENPEQPGSTIEPPVKPQSSTSEEPDNADDYEAASRSTADYIKNIKPVQAQKNSRRKKRLIWLLILVVLAAGAGAAYWKFVRPAPKQETTQQQTPAPEAPVETETAKLQRYTSQDLKLSLDYPENWQRDDATNGQLVLTSPLAKLSGSDGQPTNGKVVVTLLTAGSSPSGFRSSTGQAVLDSEKFAYVAPSTSQRQETFLSFVSFVGSDSLDALYITADSGYKTGDSVPKADVAKVEPVIGVTFVACTGESCIEPLTLSKDAWKNDRMLQTAKTILQSLTIQ